MKTTLTLHLQHFSRPFAALVLAATSVHVRAQDPATPKPATPPPPTAAPAPTATPAPAVEYPSAEPERMVFNAAPQVRIDVLMVSLPQAKALSLLPDLRDAKKIAAAQAQLLQMIERKEATLEDWPELTTYSGRRAVTENIVEFRYPIEFALPYTPEKPAPAASPKLLVNAAPPAAAMDTGVAAATTFETKNTGYTLEAEPVVSPDGTAVSINLAPQSVTLDRMADYPGGQDAKGKPITIQQPIFRTHKVQTNITLRDGERRLIYFGKPLIPDAPIHLFIIGAKIFPATK